MDSGVPSVGGGGAGSQLTLPVVSLVTLAPLGPWAGPDGLAWRRKPCRSGWTGLSVEGTRTRYWIVPRGQ